MDRDEIFGKIKESVVNQLGVDEAEVTEESSFTDDLDADSLDRVELIMEMEDNFGIKIPDEDAKDLATVADAIEYVLKHT
ncbi:MAG: acyl carrier protein [bacterium]|nr:acyl carrier protein [bacterium]